MPRLSTLFALFLFVSGLHADTTDQYVRLLAGDHEFILELARTADSKRTGLMHRPDLAPAHGLLMMFHYDQRVPIWMKNVRFPLDVVWISADGVVVDKMTLPVCVPPDCEIFRPRRPARFVLEVGGGIFPLNRGDKVEIFNASGDSLLPPAPGQS